MNGNNVYKSNVQSPPLPLRHWLLDRRSLTRRLQQHSKNQFSVTVLNQCWERPRLDEARALDIPPHQLALVREVILHGRGQPWVYARSVLPQRVLNGPLRFLRKLGNKPLGALLFSNPAIKREPVVLQRYAQSQLPPSLQQPEQQPLWGRYSIFRYGKNGILVSEIFLPALVDSVMLPL
jgi:chorismate lyase